MSERDRTIAQLDPNGFNELKMCRSGPMVYNKFDIYVGGSLQRYGEFSVGEQELFQKFLYQGAVAVEVGANIGAHTVELARMVGSDGEVHVFEPQRIVFQTLCANLALNQCTNVYAHQAALGAQNGALLVPALSPSTPANFGGLSLVNATHGESVPVFTLDSLDLPACSFLKVDVEGMEVEVLKGAQQTLAAFRPTMYLENDRDERSQELLSMVLNLDYAVYWHLPRIFRVDNFTGEKDDIFGGVVSVNILCIPNESKINVSGLRRVTAASDHWRTGGASLAEEP